MGISVMGRALTREAMSWPIHHHTARNVRRYWCDPGMNSRKTAESTGMFPPTPKPESANRAASPTNDGAPPAAIPNAPVMSSVALKEKLKRMISIRR
jgi:hypothetical protein